MMVQPIQVRGLCFEGGGAKGVAYCRAYELLRDRGHLAELEVVGGCSAGAITAGLIAAGATPEDFRSIILGTDWSLMMHDRLGYLRDIWYAWRGLGYGRLDYAREWLGDQLQRLGHKRDTTKLPTALVMTTYCETTGRFERIGPSGSDGELMLDGRPVAVVDAVLASMAHPMAYPCVAINGKEYADGGGGWNLPTDAVYDFGEIEAEEILPVMVESDAELAYHIRWAPSRISGLVDRLWRHYQGISRDANLAHSERWADDCGVELLRPIVIKTGDLGTLRFDEIASRVDELDQAAEMAYEEWLKHPRRRDP